jgi:hypothetical protein
LSQSGRGIVLFAMLSGVMRFDPGILAAAVLLGGIVIWGSNHSTAMEAVKDLAVAEADRAAMIAVVNPKAIKAPYSGVGRPND